MDKTTICVAAFERERSLVRAIRRATALAGPFRVSAIGRASASEQAPVGFYDEGHGIKRWGSASSPLADAWPPLRRAALLWVGTLGPVRVGGALVSWMLRALRDRVVFDGVSVYGLALHAIGLPEEAARRFDLMLVHGSYLLMADVDAEDVDAVAAEMRRSGATSVECIAGVDARMLSRRSDA